ncbi:MAG TPA: YraN family protein [Candidatus Magasanikbacteria bacterium]|nr:YraN family protein [Candidatus Magasanikbacteria bacterium]
MREGGGTRSKGNYGERIAADFLLHKGYDIVGRNFSKRFGEIDIVAWHTKPYFGRTLCFIEVKYRSTLDGSAERSVGKKKQLHMTRGAEAYCLEYGIDSEHTPIQFEQISIYGEGLEQKIYHYEITK